MFYNSNEKFEEFTITQLLDKYRNKDKTVQSVVKYYIDRIKAIDQSGPGINSILELNASALGRASELDNYLEEVGELVGPLHGVVFVVKDNIDTTEMDTTLGNESLVGFRPERDAVVVSRLLHSGAVILGKTTLPDFAASWFSYSSVSGETRNPYNLGHDPGGSSSGSAASVAANLAMAGLGTDSGGSIRIPASFCNLVGIRPTHGVVPHTGVGSLIRLQDTVGPLARTVKDAVSVFDVISGYDEGDPFSVSATLGRPPTKYSDVLSDGIRGAKVGLVTNALGSHTTIQGRAVNNLTNQAMEDMRAAGVEVVNITLPNLYQHLKDTNLSTACSRHDIDSYFKERERIKHLRVADLVYRGKYHSKLELLESIVTGCERSEEDPEYALRYMARAQFLRIILNVMARYALDALTYPVTRVPAPSTAERDKWTVRDFPTNTIIASQALMPSITVPAGFTEAGIPVGIEIVARPYDDSTGFRLAVAYERQSNRRRKPEFKE